MGAKNHFPMGVSSLGSAQTWSPLWLALQPLECYPTSLSILSPRLENGAGDSARLSGGWGWQQVVSARTSKALDPAP